MNEIPNVIFPEMMVGSFLMSAKAASGNLDVDRQVAPFEIHNRDIIARIDNYPQLASGPKKCVLERSERNEST